MQKIHTVALGDERSLHAVQAGRGPDLVLIHGALTTHFDWIEGPFRRLGRHFRVTAIDRPGHGLSRRQRFEGTPRAQAEQIADGLDALGVGRATFLGHSMGCLVALAMAELYPEKVERLVLVAPIAFPEMRPLEHFMIGPRAIPFFGPALSRVAAATVDRPMLKAVQRVMFAPQPVKERWEAGYPYEHILAPGSMVAEAEETAAILPFAPTGTIDLRKVRAPVHILTGTADQVANPNLHARPLAALLPDSRLTELPGVGHMLHHAEPDILIQVMNESFEPA